MDWFDSLKSSASGVLDDIVTTGSDYVSGVWDEQKNDFLGIGNSSEKKAVEEVKASIPKAADSTVAGTGVASPKRPINWAALGVVVAVIALVVR